MSTWKINPEGVQGILTSVGAEQEQLGNALKEEAFQSIFTGVSGAGSLVAEVPNALQELMEDQRVNLNLVMNSVAAGINGVANATISYNRGQEDMAGQFPQQMKHSAQTGDFSFYEQHGHKEEQP